MTNDPNDGRATTPTTGPSARTTSLIDAVVGRLSELDGVVVAYSGGVDSSVLATLAHRALPGRMVAMHATSSLVPESESHVARLIAQAAGFPLTEVDHPGTEVPAVADNRPDRCYACKGALADLSAVVAARYWFAVIAHGENADDLSCDRPGRRAAEEAGWIAPLAEVGATKADVRAMARALGLSCAETPSSPCLATRIPTGTPLDDGLLRRIGRAERMLRDTYGFGVVRVRSSGRDARIELGPESLDEGRACESDIASLLTSLGFDSVTVDPDGYRTGGGA